LKNNQEIQLLSYCSWFKWGIFDSDNNKFEAKLSLFNESDDVGITQSDPRYVGAWWIGFLILGTLLLIFTFPIALFPKRMPGMIVAGTEQMPKLKGLNFKNFHNIFSQVIKV